MCEAHPQFIEFKKKRFKNVASMKFIQFVN